ncbi:hypothetical protein [Paenibacillus sinopodophylli]|uniref:hypothetical protein n=1 Tax=Paenibacillus sinopodophylli TaxID=1837342 RepID=UPI001485E748|nr:hypothetical protein [Paenibacillus sinopodophylli]
MLGVKIKNRKGDNSDFVSFTRDDINYIKRYRPHKNAESFPVYYTSKGALAPILTLKDISLAFIQHGFNYADKSTIVNWDRVKYETKKHTGTILTFIDGTTVEISKRSVLG